MNRLLRKLLGVLGIGLSWGMVWAALFAALGLIIGIVRPQDIDPGESPVVFSGIGLLVGFVSGAVFGIILSLAENRKSIRDLGLIRVAIWGIVASAAWPLLTTVDDGMVVILCPLGAVCASASVAIARRAELPGPERAPLSGWLVRLLANPLRAVCDPESAVRRQLPEPPRV